MLKDIITVNPLENYQLYLHFEDGVQGIVDVSQLIEFTGIFAPLEDKQYFDTVKVNPEWGTICWENGADLDPDVLYATVIGQAIPSYQLSTPNYQLSMPWLTNLGINFNLINEYQIILLPENIEQVTDTSKLVDTDDAITLSKLLKEEGVPCANSYDIGLETIVIARRSIDIWLGTIWILNPVAVPLLISVVGRLVGEKIQNKLQNTEDEKETELITVHADIQILKGEFSSTSIKYTGEAEKFIKILQGISNYKKMKNESINFKSDALNIAEEWLTLMGVQEYDKANELCFGFIYTYKRLLKEHLLGEDENSYNQLLTLLIFFKGLQDFVQLAQVTKENDWYKQPNFIETVWIKMCDCKERLEFASGYCRGDVIAQVRESVDGLERFFRESFGDGTYTSPGILADKLLCSICQKDSRACAHIPGRLYYGRICRYQPINPRLEHIALVKVPKDPRCRIWSWQVKDNPDGAGATLDPICILTTFNIDDFLRKE